MREDEKRTYDIYQLYGPDEKKETFEVVVTPEITVRVRKNKWFYWKEQFFAPSENWEYFGDEEEFLFYAEDGLIFFGVSQ